MAGLDALIEAASGSGERAGLVVALAARLAHLGVALTQRDAPQLIERAAQNISIREAAERLGVSERFVYRRADSLPFMRRLGRRRVAHVPSLEAYMARFRG